MEALVERAARDLANSKHAIALTGAGMSTESGIPDFRGPSGVWTKNPEAERKAYRSYEFFREDPKAWWEDRLSTTGVLGDVEKAAPNSGHYALAELEGLGILKCVITQNVDGLHEKAGTRRLVEYHGSILKLRCVSCTARFRRDEFDLETMWREGRLPPRCPRCGGVVKTDGVAFGEPIPRDVVERSLQEAGRCDVMLICGTSAVVYPFAELPRIARQRAAAVTIIEVNATPTPLTEEGISDYLLQGRTGEILPRIVEQVKRLRAA
ncbi:MAG: NAD-dependent deacylase [Chloroflexi bacterium]|nr:NAD-dependent deacylase [Chloroflexota bacterium]